MVIEEKSVILHRFLVKGEYNTNIICNVKD